MVAKHGCKHGCKIFTKQNVYILVTGRALSLLI